MLHPQRLDRRAHGAARSGDKIAGADALAASIFIKNDQISGAGLQQRMEHSRIDRRLKLKSARQRNAIALEVSPPRDRRKGSSANDDARLFQTFFSSFLVLGLR